ncbi:conserved hypothetical protein [Desulfamplus magnetovallimortis]|uniref:Uncharacterized protein n=1 Tax=Desulfamplus magnetovallimortis TaxID=1246637 RepID=A0A1W1HLC0_9BACT|nr:conserved hypothetical protein [Desulfamplus magnetovallimortis]
MIEESSVIDFFKSITKIREIIIKIEEIIFILLKISFLDITI